MNQDLDKQRLEIAEQLFQDKDLPRIEAVNGFDIDNNILSRTVFWYNPEGDSIKGSFGVEFKNNSTEVLETWCN